MTAIRENPDLTLQLVVTGSHLSKQYGETYREVEGDGFKIDARVDLELGDDSPVRIARAMGLAIEGIARAFSDLKPDLVLVLGDRYEILAAAQAALVSRIPLAHLHGGDVTEGVIDDSMRHAITSMAHLHFVAADEFKNRVIQLGQTPPTVFNVGAIALDSILKLPLLSRDELSRDIGFRFETPTFLVTSHPVTIDPRGVKPAFENLLRALDLFPEAHILFTHANADSGGLLINQMIDAYVARHPTRTAARASLGQLRYLSAIRCADVVLGNSSSGLIEAPAFKKPTVNIGDRQKGRPRASSVIDCSEETPAIEAAIRRALSKDFQATLKNVKSPYGGQGNTSQLILDQLLSTDLSKLIPKHFQDTRPDGAR